MLSDAPLSLAGLLPAHFLVVPSTKFGSAVPQSWPWALELQGRAFLLGSLPQLIRLASGAQGGPCQSLPASTDRGRRLELDPGEPMAWFPNYTMEAAWRQRPQSPGLERSLFAQLAVTSWRPWA